MAADFEMFSGDDIEILIEIVDSAGAAVDVSTATSVDFALINRVTKIAALEKALGDGITVDEDGVLITIVPADTAEMTPGTYISELQVIDGDGLTHTALQAIATIKRDYIE